MQVAHLY